MSDLHRLFDTGVLASCAQCSDEEKRSILTYCCYMSFADKSVRRAEVETVERIAQMMGITADETAKIARRARRRVRVKKPKSVSARRLLLHLAIQLAVADRAVHAKERQALEQLAKSLGVGVSEVEEALQSERFSAPPLVLSAESLAAFARSIAAKMVAVDLEADLLSTNPTTPRTRGGEVEYSANLQGRATWEVELEAIDAPAGGTLTILVAGAKLTELIWPGKRVEQSFPSDSAHRTPSQGDLVELQYEGETLLQGVFESC